jgi:hypothetical protein
MIEKGFGGDKFLDFLRDLETLRLRPRRVLAICIEN